MKKYTLLKSLLGVLVLALSVWSLDLWNATSCEKEKTGGFAIDESEQKARAFKGAKAFMDMMTKNAESGKVEQSDFTRAFASIQSLSNVRSTDFRFVEEGPNNVGGRTRALVVDPADDNIVYAGSVSGGLYKSTNRAKT